jgi:hypothetical protein
MRHLLSYPVTHHGVTGVMDRQNGTIGWLELDRNGTCPRTDRRGYVIQSARLANQIRFKVVRQGSAWKGVIVHLPCTLPSELFNRLSPNDQRFIRNNEITTWQAVHAVIDQNVQRI